MARKRTLSPEFFTDEDVGDLEPLVRLLFQGLWCHADKAGRLKDKPRTIKAQVLPFDDIDIDASLNELADAGFILRYESQGLAVIQIRTWEKNQHPHYTEKDSQLPGLELEADNGALTVKQPLSNGYVEDHSLDDPFPCPMTHDQEPMTQAPKRKAFVKPTVEQVREYIQAQSYAVDAQAWMDHYESNGWRVGRNAMKDWQASVRTWAKNEFGGKGNGKTSSGSMPPDEYQQERAKRLARTKAIIDAARNP